MRGNGEGSVHPVVGRRLPWRATVTTGWHLDGRPVRRSRYAATQDEAEALLTEMLGDLRVGRPLADPRLTVRAWMVPWLARRTDIRATTLRTWRRGVDNITSRLGTVRLRELTPSEVEIALADMAPYIARSARSVLSIALRDAERDGLVVRNVARLARQPKVTPREIHVPTEDEAACLIAAAPGHRLGALIVTALGTAMRQGELLGMTRECLDLDAGTVRVEWSLVWIGREPRLGRPKTTESRQVVCITPFAVAALRAHLARQAEDRLAAGSRWQDADGLVFTTLSGRPLHPNTARDALTAIASAADVPRIRFHALRHAALTMIAERVGQKAAQAAARHRSIHTTDIYAHRTAEARAGGHERVAGGVGLIHDIPLRDCPRSPAAVRAAVQRRSPRLRGTRSERAPWQCT